jgi:predicted transcriptional regulator
MGKKLSPAQLRFMAVLREAGDKGDRTPFTGGRNAGRVANAWYRTAESLRRMGLVRVEREGDARRAWLVEEV